MVIQFAVLAHEVLKHDWLKNIKHSWHVLGVHGFPGRTVNLLISNAFLTLSI